MEVSILREAGYEEALLGLSLSYGKKAEIMPLVAERLSHKGGGHNKFLESMMVWIDIRAPLDFWAEFDTYRVGTSKQSESTMHTLKRRKLTKKDFEDGIDVAYLAHLNSCIDGNIPIEILKKKLPCGFLQRRIVCTNYKTLQNILMQRKGHKLVQWEIFSKAMKKLEHYNMIEPVE